MDDEWMSANEAYQRAVATSGEQLASKSLFQLASAGLVQARAERITVADEAGKGRDEMELPAAFWRPENAARVDQNWAVGALISYIPCRLPDSPNAWMAGPRQTETWTAFGVQFRRADVLSRFPKEPLASPSGDGGRGGRPPNPLWDEVLNRVWGDIYRGDFKPKNKSEIAVRIAQYFEQKGDSISEASTKPRARAIWNELHREDSKPT